jgi:DNA polymerase-1
MKVVIDIETDALDNPQNIWTIVVREVDNPDNVHIFSPRNLDDFAEFAAGVTLWIGHNILSFDLPVLVTFFPDVDWDYRRCVDTLVISRLINYKIDGGHSLNAWGERLGYPKDNFSDFSRWSKELEARCVIDTSITLKLYKKLERYVYSPKWKDALRIEHDMQWVCKQMGDTGFHFDIMKANELIFDIKRQLEELDKGIFEDFKPKVVPVKEITPKATKFGTLNRSDFRFLGENPDLTPYSPGAAFTRIEYEAFNPNSVKQIVERLNAAGWKPTSKTKGHLLAERDKDHEKLEHFKIYGWKIDEENLNTLPEDAPASAHNLAKRLMLASRLSDLEEWVGSYNERTGRIHGVFNPIGSWTHRMSHQRPNMANIPTGSSLYAKEMRSLWDSEGYLIGVDAEGIQLRILAHYINDPEFTHAIVSGDKTTGTDVHTLNQRALGPVCRTRDDAKTFIYAWLLGARLRKISDILRCSLEDAGTAERQFLERIPGLKTLKEEQIPLDAKRGYFQGLDGRFVKCDSAHLMLAGYLQNGEVIVMKRATMLWMKELNKLGIDYRLVNFVHDEWQTETNESFETAKMIAEVQAKAITQAGLDLEVRCPLAGSFLDGKGEYTIGKNWYETH